MKRLLLAGLTLLLVASPAGAAKPCVPKSPDVEVIYEAGSSVIYFRDYKYVACQRGVGKRVTVGYENEFDPKRGVAPRIAGRYAFLAVDTWDEKEGEPLVVELRLADLRTGRLPVDHDYGPFPESEDVYQQMLDITLSKRGTIHYSSKVGSNTELWRVGRSGKRTRWSAGPDVNGDLDGDGRYITWNRRGERDSCWTP
jgi:hypothetical protein